MKLFLNLHRVVSAYGWLGAGLIIFTFCAGVAGAQAPTVVQLPTFHFFSVETSVLVPDGGDALLGGVNGAGSGRVERGIPGLPSRPFTNTATGSTVGASTASVNVQIHDFAAMEDALIGPATAGGGDVVASRVPRAPLVQSLAALKAQQAAEVAVGDQEAAAALARGRQLIAEHKLGVAKIYLQTAARQSSTASDVHQQAVAELTAIAQANGEQAKAAAKIAGQ